MKRLLPIALFVLVTRQRRDHRLRQVRRAPKEPEVATGKEPTELQKSKKTLH